MNEFMTWSRDGDTLKSSVSVDATARDAAMIGWVPPTTAATSARDSV
jgi:hypothetical protein